MQEVIDTLSKYGYIILFFYSLGGGFVGIIAAGILSYIGKMDLYISMAVAATANALGDLILFYLGRYNKSVVMPYLSKHRRKLALCHVLMKKYGSKIIFFQKFVYGLKTFIPITIGLTKYEFSKFMIWNIFSAILWALFFGLLSFNAGAMLLAFADIVSQRPWIAPLIVVTLLALIWYYFSYATRKKNA
ncbi:DedA family protein [Nitrosophilus alvini]|uniref:DedA family protein n=1 Tax=Nitrosophilus alvini TaxID=2714855 RepID=UPI00190AA46F|nr:DedA family protein [Nitrosophilus alvini]